MAVQLTELKYDKAKTAEENIATIIKYINSMATTLNYTLNNFDARDVNTSSGVSLQDLYATGALRGERGPQGERGVQGIPGPQGEPGYTPVKGVDYFDGKDGKDGIGIPAGGTAGQVLAKKTNTDYDTEWITLPTV